MKVGRGRSSLVAWCILAGLLHAGAGAILPHQRAASEPLPAHDAPTAETLEIDLEREPPTPAVATATVTPAVAAVARGRRELARGGAATMPAGASADPPGDDAPAREPDPGWSFSPVATGSARPDVLGLNEHTGALARLGGVTVARAPADHAGLGSAMDALDRAHGAARGGPLKDAVEEAVRSPNAPAAGTATFEIVVGPSHLATTRLLESSSDEAGWASLRAAIDVAARKKTLRFPIGAARGNEGLRVVIRVEAAQHFPNGMKPSDLGAHVTKTELGLNEHAGPGESKLSLPSATLHLRGKVCSLSLTLGVTASPIGGGCDPAAIGTRSARRVTTTIVSEERVSLAE